MIPPYEKNATLQDPEKPRAYGSEMEKQLMIDNLKVAVEIYGKDRLREVFKFRKNSSC